MSFFGGGAELLSFLSFCTSVFSNKVISVLIEMGSCIEPRSNSVSKLEFFEIDTIGEEFTVVVAEVVLVEEAAGVDVVCVTFVVLGVSILRGSSISICCGGKKI